MPVKDPCLGHCHIQTAIRCTEQALWEMPCMPQHALYFKALNDLTAEGFISQESPFACVNTTSVTVTWSTRALCEGITRLLSLRHRSSSPKNLDLSLKAYPERTRQIGRKPTIDHSILNSIDTYTSKGSGVSEDKQFSDVAQSLHAARLSGFLSLDPCKSVPMNWKPSQV
eukprot:6128542-Amphidinium_carterae.1